MKKECKKCEQQNGVFHGRYFPGRCGYNLIRDKGIFRVMGSYGLTKGQGFTNNYRGNRTSNDFYVKK